MYILKKKTTSKLKSILFFHFMTTFYNYAKRVVKPISATANTNNVIEYVCFVNSGVNNF